MRTVEYGETIVEQGSVVNSIYFVSQGQATISVNTFLHLSQYRGMISEDFDDKLAELSRKEEDDDEDETIARFSVLKRRRKKKQKGFFATEVRNRSEIELCVIVGANGVIGKYICSSYHS